MSNNNIIWLDDERNPKNRIWRDYIQAHAGDGEVIWVKSRAEFEATVLHLGKGGFKAIFFDNDLGSIEVGQEGRHCFWWLDELIRTEPGWHEFKCFVQSSNPVASIQMRDGIERLYNFWHRQEQDNESSR